MKEFEKFGCLLEFFYFLNPFVEILSALLVLMLIEADYSSNGLDLGLSQIGHNKMHKTKQFPRIPLYIFHTRKFFTTFLYFVLIRL
jgi:hypothetical protein